MENKRIIEINGVKIEIDLEGVNVNNNFKVGDYVKILIKEHFGFKSYIGNIIGFDNYQKTPTIVIAYLRNEFGYATTTIEFIYLNSNSENIEITALHDWDIPLKKMTILEQFQKEILIKEQEVLEMKNKADIFEILFGKYFEGKQ
jgi:hypothetical protein